MVDEKNGNVGLQRGKQRVEKKKVWTIDLIKLIFSTPQKALANPNFIKFNLISHSRPSPQAFPRFNNLNSPS
jgi:hypothetical protein